MSQVSTALQVRKSLSVGDLEPVVWGEPGKVTRAKVANCRDREGWGWKGKQIQRGEAILSSDLISAGSVCLAAPKNKTAVSRSSGGSGQCRLSGSCLSTKARKALEAAWLCTTLHYLSLGLLSRLRLRRTTFSSLDACSLVKCVAEHGLQADYWQLQYGWRWHLRPQ